MDGTVVWMPGGVRTEIRFDAEQTAGAFCLLIDEPPVGWSLLAHRHLREAETIHVVKGEFDMEIAGVSSRLGPGETVHVPAGVVHAGANVAEETGQRVVMFHPAGLERFFREVGTSSPSAPVDTRRALQAARRHGWEFLAADAQGISNVDVTPR